MGSSVASNNCERFTKIFGELALQSNPPLKVGSTYKVTSAGIGLDPLSEVGKIYFLLKDTETDEDVEVTTDEVVFDPDESAEDAVERIVDIMVLAKDPSDTSLRSAVRPHAISLLKRAEFLDEDYVDS